MAFYDPIINFAINKVIKSPNFKARVLAAVRHGITSAGAGLVTAGYANSSLVDAAAGLAVMAVSFYLSQLDVTWVDGKLKVALATPVPGQTVQTTQTATSNNDLTGDTLTTVRIEVKPLDDITPSEISKIDGVKSL